MAQPAWTQTPMQEWEEEQKQKKDCCGRKERWSHLSGAGAGDISNAHPETRQVQ
jgi:hypothetical protein